MSSGFLYHAWGLYFHKCSREEYKGNTIILHIEIKECQKICPLCGHTHLVKNGYRIRDFISLLIGIDEFAVRKDHIYKTIVVDLRTGLIIYVGAGKCADSMDRFWERVRRKGLEIKYVATDLPAAFISSVSENCFKAIYVFDHFHVMKLMNDKLDEIRRVQYNMEKNVNKRKVLKGTRYLLLKNGADISDKEYRTKLENALAMNRPLSEGYYLKEQIREIWMQPDRKEAEQVLLD